MGKRQSRDATQHTGHFARSVLPPKNKADERRLEAALPQVKAAPGLTGWIRNGFRLDPGTSPLKAAAVCGAWNPALSWMTAEWMRLGLCLETSSFP